MTPQQAKELLPIIQAYADGKTIQTFCYDGAAEKWFDLDDPEFTNPASHYRIKPEPTLRPWTMDEIRMLQLDTRFYDTRTGRFIMAGYPILIISAIHSETLSFTSFEIRNNARFNCPWYSPGTLAQYFAHSTDHGVTWLPCGVMEEA